MEDEKIVELYLNRDEQAIKETQNKYANYCFTIANNILHDSMEAEECLNDTYQGAWNSIPPHHPLNLSAYLGKITRRLALNVYRNKNTLKRGGGIADVSFDEISECVADNRTIKQELDAKYLAETIDKFLADIKETERKVFVCRYWYFESIEEISERFNYSQSKVKMMLKRTRDKLRVYLEKEGISV